LPLIFKIIFYCIISVNEFPVLKADAIKFIMIFRSILPREQVVGSLPQMIRHLSAISPVVHSYAACAIEKILVLKNQENIPLLEIIVLNLI
jgi:exportin-2 (importin alpha re-exporter)